MAQGRRDDSDGVFMTLDHITAGHAVAEYLLQCPNFGVDTVVPWVDEMTDHVTEAQLAHICEKKLSGSITAYKLSHRLVVEWLKKKVFVLFDWSITKLNHR